MGKTMKTEESRQGENPAQFNLLYYTDINQSLSSNEYEHCIHLVSPETRYKIERFHFENDRKRTLYGEVLARCLFMKFLGEKNNNLVIERNPYGKPYFAGIDTLYHNISHSGRFVLCGISSEQIGVDIEEIKESNMDIAQFFFTEQEHAVMLGLGENEVKKRFYTYWTLKESYIKRIGMGLSIPLNSFSIKQVNDSFEVDKTIFIEKIQLYTNSLEAGYMISAAYSNDKSVKLIYADLREALRKRFDNEQFWEGENE